VVCPFFSQPILGNLTLYSLQIQYLDCHYTYYSLHYYVHSSPSLVLKLQTSPAFSIGHLVTLHGALHSAVFYGRYGHYHMENRLKKESTLYYTGQNRGHKMVLLVHLVAPHQEQLPAVGSLPLIAIQLIPHLLIYSKTLQFLDLVGCIQAVQMLLRIDEVDQQIEERQRGRHLGNFYQSIHTAHHLHEVQTHHEDLTQQQIWVLGIMELKGIGESYGTVEAHVHLPFFVYAIEAIGK
jgi:hypothetical protein